MSEIGLVASIIGLAGAGAKCALCLFQLADQIRFAESEIRTIASEISLFSQSVNAVSRILERKSEKQTQLLDIAVSVTKACESLLNDLEILWRDLSWTPAKLSSHRRRLKWIFKKPKVLALRASMEAFKSTLTLLVVSMDAAEATFKRAPDEIMKPLQCQVETMLRVSEHSSSAMIKCRNSKSIEQSIQPSDTEDPTVNNEEKILTLEVVSLNADESNPELPQPLTPELKISRMGSYEFIQSDSTTNSTVENPVIDETSSNTMRDTTALVIHVKEQVQGLAKEILRGSNRTPTWSWSTETEIPKLSPVYSSNNNVRDRNYQDENFESTKPESVRSNRDKSQPYSSSPEKQESFEYISGQHAHEKRYDSELPQIPPRQENGIRQSSAHKTSPQNSNNADNLTRVEERLATRLSGQQTQEESNDSGHPQMPPRQDNEFQRPIARQSSNNADDLTGLEERLAARFPGLIQDSLMIKLAEMEQARRDAEEEAARLRPPDDMLQPPVKFKDAVGRNFSFPWHLCKTWKGMEELIQQAFLGVDGIGQHVHEGHYDLTGPNGEIILPQVWETMIKPDMSVTMLMWPMPEPKKKTIGDPFLDVNQLLGLPPRKKGKKKGSSIPPPPPWDTPKIPTSRKGQHLSQLGSETSSVSEDEFPSEIGHNLGQGEERKRIDSRMNPDKVHKDKKYLSGSARLSTKSSQSLVEDEEHSGPSNSKDVSLITPRVEKGTGKKNSFAD